MLEWIVSVDYICKDEQFTCPLCKLVIKQENMINEDKRESLRKISKIRKMSDI